MAQVVLRECPNCAGVLPPVGDANQVKCEYCGLSFDVRRTVEQPKFEPPRPAPRPPRIKDRYVTPSTPRRTNWTAIVLLALVSAAIAGVVLWNQVPSTAGPGVVSNAVGVNFMGMVGFHAVNGDGIEDLVALVRTAGSGSGGDEVLVVAFDGASMREIWRAGPFGSYGQASQYTHAAVLGNRALVVDLRAQAHWYDLATGAPLTTLALPDRATDVCAVSSPTQVQLRLQNGRRIVLDAATGAAAPPGPIVIGADTCVPPGDLSVPQGPPVFLQAGALQAVGPERSGNRIIVLEQDGIRIAVGRRPAGIRVPAAVGLGPDGATPVWTAVIPTVDETKVAESGSDTLLFGRGAGRLYAAYTLTGDNGARLAALDARTGARLWETQFTDWTDSPDLNAMRVGPNRILIEEFIEAAVFDAQTGALVARIADN